MESISMLRLNTDDLQEGFCEDLAIPSKRSHYCVYYMQLPDPAWEGPFGSSPYRGRFCWFGPIFVANHSFSYFSRTNSQIHKICRYHNHQANDLTLSLENFTNLVTVRGGSFTHTFKACWAFSSNQAALEEVDLYFAIKTSAVSYWNPVQPQSPSN